MADFVLHLFQDGGCDYTIGCGHVIKEFSAFSENEMKEKVKGIITDYGRESIHEVKIYEITNNKGNLDIDALFAEDDEKKRNEAIKQEEDKERELLKKLKEKYPDA